MTRSTRARSDASQPQSPTTRRSIQLSPRQSVKPDDHREGVLRSPTSPTTRKTPRLDLADELLPSTPEEWIVFAQTKLRRAAATPDMADTILDFAEIEPDLLEFLLAADEEIRETISEALCGPLFPNTCEAWKESIISALLERFRAYFDRLPLKLVSRKVDEEGRRLPYLTIALEALDHLGLGNLGDLEGEGEGEGEKANSLPKLKNKAQKRRKTSVSIANQAHWSNGAVDPRVFKAAEVDFPARHMEAMGVQSALLLRLREVLKMYLASFAKQGFADQTKALYLKVPVEFLPSTSDSATIVDDAGAFSRIQPLASAKYFDEDSLPGDWPVLITKRAMADLRRMRKRDSPGYYMVNKKLEELSEGFFSDSNQKRLVGLGTEVPIYEAKVSRDMRIVYQVDIRTDEEAKFDEQVIKIYGVYTHAQLDNRMWSQISHSLEHRGKEYRQRCLYRETHRAPGQNVTSPAQFPHEGSGAPTKASSSSTRAQRETTSDIDDQDLDLLYTLGEFVPMSQSLITPILNDKDHPFRPSDKEKEVIYHDSSCFVLGRSGTGKTTCIVFKMLGIEILFESMVDVPKPRQVFVTQSRMLAQRVQEHYQKIMKGSFGMLTELNLDEPEEDVLADLEDEDDEALGLPPKYSMLEDRHFPLFLSFDQLCSLLEADFGLEFGQVVGNKTGATARGANAMSGSHQESQVVQPDPGAFFDPDFVTELFEHERIKKAKQAMITFDKFLVAYWPRFDHRLKKGFDPALVYSEFLGVIEGSEAALDTESGALSREEYTEGRYRRSSFASQREYVYDLYEAYCVRRGQLGHCDVAQRTHALVKAMKSRVPGKKLDCLYAQDNLLIDIKLLHTLSSNPHGIFMAGDTAQTISAGSSFRFEDLKAFMWRLEGQNKAVQAKKRKAIHPTLFHLAVNYRSHRGIVDCASSIVLLVSELFPDSIDRLQKESGLDDGPPPIFFSGWERGVTHFERFLRGGKNGSINFGASQAILVRNDAARDALRHQVGNIGVILTLYESKGLEFDDVLLYNFFEDSLPELATWRIVLTGIAPVPDFDELRHSVICAELKHLYVGLTRARKNCWIWDMSETAEAIKEFWSAYGLVTHHGPEDPVPQLGVSSTKDAWEERGRSFFNKELYSQAVFCFEKAGMVVERDIATAYESRKQARLSQAAGLVDKAHQSFLEAAERYLQCARSSKGKQQKSCYLRAAECFTEIEDWKSTAEAFLWAGNFDLAAKNFRRAGCFDEAVGVVKSHRDHMQEEVVGEVIEVAKLEYLRTQKFEQAEELFDDLDKELESMEGYGLGTAQIHVLERQERYEDAAEVAFAEHNTMEGIRLLLRSNTPGSARQVVEKALDSLWILLPFGPLDDNKNLESTGITSLIQHLRNAKSKLKKNETHQFEVFRALHTRDRTRLLELAQSYVALGDQAGARGRPPAPLSSALSLLCFSYSSNLLIPAKGWTIPEFVRRSKLSLLYFSQLLHLGRTLDLSTPSSQKLMGLEAQKAQAINEAEHGKPAPTEFWVHSSSMIFDVARSVPGVLEPTPSDLGPSFLVLAEVDAHRLIRSAIREALRFEIQKTTINDTVDHSQYLEPCLGYAIFGRCNREECSRQEVNSLRLPEGQRQEAFNLRVQALVSQLEVIRMYPPEDVTEYRKLTRTWICKAYELFMPHFPPIGSAVCIDPARVPEITSGFNIIAMWCADALHYTEPKVIYGPRMLSCILAYLDLAFRVKSTSTKFETYVYGLHSARLVEPRADLMLGDEAYPHSPYSIVHDFINFYGRKTGNALGRVIRAMHHIVTQRVSIEANVLVHMLEFIGREVIVHCRRWSGASEGITIFDRMLVPQSWALDLVTQPALMLQRGFYLSDFWHTLYNTIALLHSHEPSAQAAAPRTLFGFNSSVNFLVRSILIMRICRLLVIVASNIGVPLHEKDAMRLKVSSLLNESGNLHTMCTRFANAQSWMDFQSALEYSPLNRGADEMVFLTLRRNSLPSPSIHGAKTISYVNIFPDLAQRLSLNGATKHAGVSFSPLAKSSAYSTSAHALPGSQTGGRAGTDMFASVLPPHSNYSPSVPNPEIQRILTSNEVNMGKKILSCYRRYIARQKTVERAHAAKLQVEAQRAAQTIWAYYYRYRLRHLAPQTSVGVKIRKLHTEYMHDVDRIARPPAPVEFLRQHKRVLLGCMPHVLVYLHGLEEANRQEQDSKKKALLTANHRYLEKLQSRIQRCGVFAKKIKTLIKDLSPGSSRLHHFDGLQGRVKRAVDARLAVTQVFGKDAIPVDLELHYALGVEVILAQSSIPAQPNPRH